MTTPDSTSSGAESTMDESSNDHHPTTTADRRGALSPNADQLQLDLDGTFSNTGDAEVWGNFTDSFRQVQSVLDRNRLLIQQVNENHRSKIHENMVKNVALIQEINGNISKVVSLYSDLSTNFSSVFHQRNGEADASNRTGEANEKKWWSAIQFPHFYDLMCFVMICFWGHK